MEKNILLILGHPSEDSYCKALLDAYQSGAESAGANCKTIYISRLNFDVNLSDGYKNGEVMQLEENLINSQRLIQWADHVVLAYPNWWGFMPAITKGFIDRIFLPGFAFKNHSGKNFPEKLLKGKSMRILVTMDTPTWWFYIIYRASQYQILKDIIFGYVGFDPIRFSTFGFIRKSTDEHRKNWLRKVQELGKQFR
ncbi:NAD(P)H-dependent oxidoreductase [Dyadobacter fanqingshengii]|uniref:NAD(P)H-dependent oxidoreductase n=1 Tax=Dyadobacter fanqingshengii TaxID=2906443 RepID=A0A9X1P7E1_9BACT|nr:NAD(P)H-dependent oxidoreductase [Dyadobacter fanqingshengii]MCF0039731.1 NAD(P)H-dependent oxidoreductase [Dyadobacter fanqingshengii]USJ38506.1 NAD(P)H-dependent oxidoreductase [Dyadobacter fanqingshengii]